MSGPLLMRKRNGPRASRASCGFHVLAITAPRKRCGGAPDCDRLRERRSILMFVRSSPYGEVRTMKRVTAIHGSPEGHWVGDGFPVRSLFSYHTQRGGAEPVPAARLRGPGGIRARRAPARRRRAPASRLRDGDDRLSGRGRASRFRRQRRQDRAGRRAVDDGGGRADARGIPLAGVHASAAARWRWRSSG